MKRIHFISICLFLSGFTMLRAQSPVHDFLDLDAFINAKAIPQHKINTDKIEFAPCFYKEGLLFVYSDTDKKRFKRKDEINFMLQYAAIDQEGNCLEKMDFDELRVEGSFEGPVAVSDDARLLFVTRNLQKPNLYQENRELKLGIFIYEEVNGHWVSRGKFPSNNPRFNVCHPSWDQSSQNLIFASDMPGGAGKLDLYESKRDKNGNWSNPVNLGPEINGPSNDCFPFIYKDDFLFFSSDRPGSLGGLDIFASVNQSKNWSVPVRVPGIVNSSADDLNLIIDEMGDEVYFASSRTKGKGYDDLYHISLESGIVKKNPDLHEIEVFHAETKLPVENAKIGIYGFETSDALVLNEGDKISALNYNIDSARLELGKVLHTNETGTVNFNISENEYILEVQKRHFQTLRKLIRIGDESTKIQILLDSNLCKNLFITFIDQESEKVIRNVELKVTEGKSYESNKGEKISLCLGEGVFRGLVFADAYLRDTLVLKYEEVKNGQELVYFLEPVEKYVTELPIKEGEKFILNNILYEFDQSVLTKSAKAELQKLIRHLIRYPGLTIELSAHTDSRGRELYNQILSDQRAANARNFLIENGIDERRIAAVGYGESRLKNNCMDGIKCSEKEHSENRRTEVKVITHDQ